MARHHVVFGLGFGDEGKGTIVDYLARREKPALVVRFNGGAQAAHNVVTPEGVHHTFSQYGSGAFAGCDTFLSRFMLVNPLTMLTEGDALAEKLHANPLMYVDEHCLITTPYHVGLNRLREACLRHGSCGMGIGETKLWEREGFFITAQALTWPDIEERFRAMRDQLFDVGLSLVKQAAMKLDTGTIADALALLSYDPKRLTEQTQDWLATVSVCSADWLPRKIREGARCLFEGAQGVLLDETHGWAPHHTWSTCTPANALTLLAEAGVPRDDVDVIGVLRAYQTRHGAGPLPTEFPGSKPIFAEAHNGQHAWQGAFRWGAFDGRLARYALEVSGRVDGLAITHLDHIPESGVWDSCTGYRNQPGSGKPDVAAADLVLTDPPHLFESSDQSVPLSWIREAIGGDAPRIRIASYGPKPADKIEVVA